MKEIRRFDEETRMVFTKEEYLERYKVIRTMGIDMLAARWELLPTVSIGYDSEVATLKHIKRVSELLNNTAIEFLKRANCHDDSKLKMPEKEIFDKFTPLLKGVTYMSDEYKGYLKGLGKGLEHHYTNNSHHPEHYENGINGMNLFDVLEMFFDWKAAGERHADGNIYKSIEHNKGRFEMSPQLVDIFTNTAKYLGYE